MSERDDFLGRERSKSYDADGNLTGDGLWDYQYDAENRLIRMETASVARSVGIPHRVLEYRYDYKGRRVQKRVLDGVSAAELSSRRYLYDGWNLIAEWTAPGGTSLGTLVRSYTWGLDLTGSLTGSGGVGALVQIADHATGKTYLPAYDGNGNVAALLNGDTGARAAVYEYDPYGKLLRHEVTDAAVADQPFLFSTKFTDRETGLVYYGYRYYSPALGRFVNRDPIEEQGGINLYAFCGNNGVNAWDVLGMETRAEQDARVKAAEAWGLKYLGATFMSYIGALKAMNYRAEPPSYSGQYDNIYVTSYNFGPEYNAIADSMGIGTISDPRTGENITAGMAAGNLSQSSDGIFTYSDAFTGVTTSFTPTSSNKTPVVTYGNFKVVDDVPTTKVETEVNLVATPGTVSGGVYGEAAPNSTGAAAGGSDGSALGNLLRHVPFLGGTLGAVGDVVSGVGNVALGVASLGQSGTFGRGLGQVGSGVGVFAADIGAAAYGFSIGKITSVALGAGNLLTGNYFAANYPNDPKPESRGFFSGVSNFVRSVVIPTYGFNLGVNYGGVQQGFCAAAIRSFI